MTTVLFLSFRTEKSEQTVQTQIRLLLKEQSDQGLHCLLFVYIIWTHFSMVKPRWSNFRMIITFSVSEFLGFLRYPGCFIFLAER